MCLNCSHVFITFATNLFHIMAKNLINKYVWLAETIYKSGPITFEEINEKWLDQDMDDKPIPLRTFHKWRIAAEEMFNLNIECERRGGYHYYIDNAEEIKSGGLRNWLLNTISVSNLLLDSQSLKDRILIEDVPSGQNHLAVILEAMKTNTQLSITYQSYWRDESNTFDVYPFCVKQPRRLRKRRLPKRLPPKRNHNGDGIRFHIAHLCSSLVGRCYRLGA